LFEFLTARGGVAEAPLVKDAAAQAGIAERTLERARSRIAASIRQGFGEPSLWKVRGELDEEPSDAEPPKKG
jgi:hypothetical protein